MAALRSLWRQYERLLSARPIPTQMLTSALLWCMGDLAAQRVEHLEASIYGASSTSSTSSSTPPDSSPPQHRQHVSPTSPRPEQQQHQQQHQHQQPFELDRRRLALTSAFGAGFIGPVGHLWYEGIERACRRLVPSGGARFLVAKVVLDSAIMGSVYVVAFFAFISTALEGTGLQGFKHKMQVDFAPTYAAELAFWPLVQTLNFSKVPVRHQLLVVNAFSLLDAAFISWVGNQSDWSGKLMQRLGLSPHEAGSQKPEG